MNKKIEYNKQMEPGKQWRAGGPRDMQAKRLSFTRGNAVIQLPNVNAEELNRLLQNNERKNDVVSKRGDMSFEEVKLKIDEAVKFTVDREKQKYEGSLKNLNSQLNSAKQKINILENQLSEKISKLKDLENKRIDSNDVDEEVKKLNIKLQEKDNIISKLSDDYVNSVLLLKDKLEEINLKLSDGSYNLKDGSVKDRPEIDTNVFIDPLDEANAVLDSHIGAGKSDILDSDIGRDIKKDLSKLKKLLDKKE
jgi:hypothetical protein